MRVVVCGGGVIGASIAYFLSRRGIRTIVLERTGIACAASGKSGGFLALDWCDGTPLEALARRSFRLHARLPEEIGGDWGYRPLTTYSGRVGRSVVESPVPQWLSRSVGLDRRLGRPETTAQVHPGRFTAALMRSAEEHGAEVRIEAVTGVALASGGNRVAGVETARSFVEADAVVIAMGPWSALAAEWLPIPKVHGLKGHSLVFETGTAVPAEALFLEFRDGRTGAAYSPEVFPRPDGTTYVCAVSSESPVPPEPGDVAPDPGAMPILERLCSQISPELQESRIVARQACYRPVTRDGLPLIGAIPGIAGAFVATGHSVWGILNAPATGEAVAELIADGAARHVDLSWFSPGQRLVT
ncbi:MAG TPA: FAD-dependent oxidoreductase [Beijerinckiaceae bacterium]|jgi:glycine/D-amino acid oxidase-like deaminating enzyme